jgi:hypothetical protein
MFLGKNLSQLGLIYSKGFLTGIYKEIGLENSEEQNQFFRLIEHANELYSFLKNFNPKNSKSANQKRLLEQYRNTARKTKDLYDAIQKDNVCEGRLSIALRNTYNELTPDIQKIVAPYMAEGRYEALFANILELHAKASEDAPNLVYDKLLPKEILQQWLVTYKVHWPKSAKEKFALGNHIKGYGYKSKSCDVLHSIITKIDPKLTRVYVGDLMKEIIKNDITQAPAYFTKNLN